VSANEGYDSSELSGPSFPGACYICETNPNLPQIVTMLPRVEGSISMVISGIATIAFGDIEKDGNRVML
jgi:hypothetical protein